MTAASVPVEKKFIDSSPFDKMAKSMGGFIDGPEPDPAIREELESIPTPELHARLRGIDPDGAERIHPNDRRRTIRSLEVHAITGTTLSELQGQWEAAGGGGG